MGTGRPRLPTDVATDLLASADRGNRVLEELRRVIKTQFDTDYGGHLLVIRADEWHAHFWWDMVPAKLRVRLIGNMDSAYTDLLAMFEHEGPYLHVRAALDREVARLEAVPWGPASIPGKKKTKSRGPKEDDGKDDTIPGKLVFGMKVDIRPKKGRRKRT